MFFKIAFRNLIKRKVYASINIAGLAIGLAACLTIYLYVKDELSYDKFYPDSDRIYRVVREFGQGGDKSYHAANNFQLGVLMRENLSQIKQLTQFSQRIEAKIENGDKIFREKNAHFADNEFFDVFGINLLKGNKNEALVGANKIVLTKESSNKIFGSENPIGKLIKVNDLEYQVTGIVEGFPEKAHFHFNYLLSMETSRQVYGQSMFEHWGNVWVYNYAKLNDGVKADEFDEAINQMAHTHGPGDALNAFNVRFFSQNIEDIHLHSNLSSELEQNGDFELLSILGAVAVLILLIACFNFINLSTARSMWRAKEVGVKKVLGIHRSSLIRQFLGESLLITFLSLILAVFLIATILPFFNDFTGKSIGLGELFLSLPALVMIVLFVGLVAGSFPAFILSSFEPIKILKGQSSQGDSKMAGGFRQVLVVLQFAIAIVLIAGATIIYQQLNYIQTKDLGTDIEGVVALQLKNSTTRENREPLKNALNQIPAVTSISSASDLPFESLNSWRTKPKGMDVDFELINLMAVDDAYINSLDIKVIDGEAKKLDEKSVVVNESFVKHYMLANPVGSEIEIGHLEEPLRVVAVVKDFHFESLHTAVRPLMLYKHPSWFTKLAVRVATNDLDKTLAKIESQWKQINKDEEFSYYFLGDRFDQLYASEEKTAKMVAYFSGFSIFIACLGLYGLAAFLAETKLKEISIRKVLGATINELVSIQFKLFLKLVALAAAIGLPIAYLLLDGWLNGFAYRVQIQTWVLILAVAIILIFTVLSVGYSSLKAALTNPSDNLRVDS
ncbi:MAG: ABC transporter permease [Fulvivirga sp.]|uniref:ABC transporter permease n=1 Tax=Fulvivirga sp. TaxID=1931237 RepID=UPI0032F037CD